MRRMQPRASSSSSSGNVEDLSVSSSVPRYFRHFPICWMHSRVLDTSSWVENSSQLSLIQLTGMVFTSWSISFVSSLQVDRHFNVISS